MRWPIEEPRSFVCVLVVQEGSNPRTSKQAEYAGRMLHFQAVVCVSLGNSAIMVVLII